jgi:hypothetical protein
MPLAWWEESPSALVGWQNDSRIGDSGEKARARVLSSGPERDHSGMRALRRAAGEAAVTWSVAAEGCYLPNVIGRHLHWPMPSLTPT